ncbi:hypothetical protein LOTGIDRAFT_113088 [Lottia gigantea]|uniref:AN1-type domain-containing protein n=1 Tax=Lottia gigantea TaxID=225164 RepID=V4CDL8_LOTGI|nr:hypothetical protein LOTGIDRAFT_113088 [Lottia gigantea]ESP00020.1 hypothetical protein LOTGIDRAFT_113088 [Lottia gigantea]
MELPDLGKHCSQASCKQLDFLPMKCDCCFKIYCGDHVMYNSHSCSESYKKDNQVPVCPLCNSPIPVKQGESADVVVGRHIDTDCQSDPAKERRKVYTNKCSAKGCKHKELVPVICEKCRKNFCLKHRHELDHNCQVNLHLTYYFSAAAFSRFTQSSSNTKKSSSQNKPQQSSLTSIGSQLNRSVSRQQPSVQSVQAGLSEDEALARAIQMSMSETRQQKPTTSKDEDLMLAQALYESEQEAARNQRQVGTDLEFD